MGKRERSSKQCLLYEFPEFYGGDGGNTWIRWAAIRVGIPVNDGKTPQREEKASGLGLREELCKTAGR